MFSGKEVDFARNLLEKQHEFNATSLEVNKIQKSFYMGLHAQQKFALSCLQEARQKSAVRSRLP